jgi:hypothetical protein
MALDPAGNIYFASYDGQVRMVPAGGGAIRTVAGSGYGTDGLDGISASLTGLSFSLEGLAFDSAGNLYIADTWDYRIRKVTFPGTTSTPTFSLAAGIYAASQSLTISDATSNATIYYTTDGSMPTTSSAVYSGPLQIATTETVRAIAVAPNLATSMAMSALYQIGDGQRPTITWATPDAITYGTKLGAAQLDATSSLAGAFSYSPAAGTTLTAGTHTLTATFIPVNTEQNERASATVQLVVNQVTPSITWSAPASIAYGTALGTAQLDATASVAGTFTYSPAAGTVLTAGTHTLTATFTPTDATDYTTTTATAQIQVKTSTPTITWSTPAQIAYGTALGSAQLDATASVAGTFAYSPAAGTVLQVGNQTLTATFTPADGTDYTEATSTVTLLVVNPAPVLSSLSPAFANAGGSTFALVVDGNGFMPGSTVYWAKTALTTQYVSGTELKAAVPASNIASSGEESITVQTPSPGGGTSSSMTFEVDSASTAGGGVSFTTATATIQPGATASYPVTLPSGVESTTVSCLNLPAGATCSYSNGTVSIATSANTPAGTYEITVVFTETLAGTAAGLSIPLLLLPLGLRRRRRRMAKAMLVGSASLLLVAAALFAGGCGGGGASMGSGSGSGSTQSYQATNSGTVSLIVK